MARATCAGMHVACPACAAAYEIPDELLADGPRLLRCAACGAQFEAAAPVVAPAVVPSAPAPSAAAPAIAAPQAAPPAAPAAAEHPAADPAAQPTGRRGPPEADRPPPTRGPAHPSPAEPLQADAAPRRRLAAAWLLSFALIGLAIWAGLHWRAEVMQAWPPAARLYAALGFV